MSVLLAFAAAALAPQGHAVRPPAHRARANLAQYVTDADYPALAIRRGEQGIAGFALDVDAAGRVSACTITQTSGSAQLDETTCRIMRERAQFTPARDRRGHAVADHVESRLRWVLPEDDASLRARTNLASYISDADYPAAAIRAGEQGTVGFMLDIGPDGLVSNCRITSSSGSTALDEATCRIMRDRPRFRPALDSQGHPTTDQIKSRIRWVLPAATDVDLSGFITSADYPPEARNRREAGRIEVELILSADGRVSRCRVTHDNGSTSLATQTCELIRARVQFEGREAGAAQAAPDVVEGYVDWVLPAA